MRFVRALGTARRTRRATCGFAIRARKFVGICNYPLVCIKRASVATGAVGRASFVSTKGAHKFVAVFKLNPRMFFAWAFVATATPMRASFVSTMLAYEISHFQSPFLGTKKTPLPKQRRTTTSTFLEKVPKKT